MQPGVDPKVDYAFKKLFGSPANADLLTDLLNAVLQPAPGQEVVAVEILNPFNDKETSADKLSILDVKAREASGRLFNVEMQMLAPIFFPSRVLYYWARLYASQLAQGRDYDTLRPTVSISFVDNVLFPDAKAYHHRFTLLDRDSGLVLTNDLSIHILELPGFELQAGELTTALDRWCYFLRHGETLDTARLPPALAIPVFNRALEVLHVMTQSDVERELYESRLRAQRDYSSGMKAARQEGILVGQVLILQELLGQPSTPREELLALRPERLTALIDELKQQLRKGS